MISNETEYDNESEFKRKIYFNLGPKTTQLQEATVKIFLPHGDPGFLW
jgi:hypothetical protein